MNDFYEDPQEPSPSAALLSGLAVLAVAAVVGGILYWTLQLWFWLEDVL